MQMPPPVSLTPRTNGTTGLRAGCGLCMHQYIIGATRSGKSNYLMTLARSEEPFCFIDKHGTTARQIADAMLCIYWRPADLNGHASTPRRKRRNSVSMALMPDRWNPASTSVSVSVTAHHAGYESPASWFEEACRFCPAADYQLVAD